MHSQVRLKLAIYQPEMKDKFNHCSDSVCYADLNCWFFMGCVCGHTAEGARLTIRGSTWLQKTHE